jgi:hypothetical protein
MERLGSATKDADATSTRRRPNLIIGLASRRLEPSEKALTPDGSALTLLPERARIPPAKLQGAVDLARSCRARERR